MKKILLLFLLLSTNVAIGQKLYSIIGDRMTIGVMDSFFLELDVYYKIDISTSDDYAEIISFAFELDMTQSEPLIVLGDRSITSRRKMYLCIDFDGIYYMVTYDHKNAEVSVYEPATHVYTVLKSPRQIIHYE